MTKIIITTSIIFNFLLIGHIYLLNEKIKPLQETQNELNDYLEFESQED